MHVDMVLHARDQLPSIPANLFVRRALWEGTLIAYGRVYNGGRRQVSLEKLQKQLGAKALSCHEAVAQWRNQHAAHRVDSGREEVEARILIDSRKGAVVGVHARVTTITGPEDEGNGLAAEFKAYVKELRDLIWKEKLHPLESKIAHGLLSKQLDELRQEAANSRIGALLKADTPSSSSRQVRRRNSDPAASVCRGLGLLMRYCGPARNTKRLVGLIYEQAFLPCQQ